MTAKILLVDDDEKVLSGLGRHLRNLFDVVAASSGEQALNLAESEPELAVVVADMSMPGMSGIELLSALRYRSPNTVRLMLTGNTEVDTAVRAINEGNIFKFLSKPCSPEALITAISQGVEEHDRIVRQRALEQELRDFAYTDELSKVNNRRRFLELAEVELKRARRFGHPLSIGLVDIDHFKEINDDHGHGNGDDVLRTVAQTAESALRDIDIFGRYGGDEFVMLLVETDIRGALTAAERVRKCVSEKGFESDDGDFRATVSIGLASLAPGESFGDVLERADKALYLAKVNGRNRTEPKGCQLAN
jgi:diguanylate cyclase (GGDEF)-like protein